jgi:hypothetical protein
MDSTKELHQILCRSQKNCVAEPGNDEINVQGIKHEPYTKGPNSPRPKKVRQVKSKAKSMLITFYDIKGIVHKEFILAGQIINPHTTVTFYGDCIKMCEDFTPNFGNKRTGCCIMTKLRHTLPFPQGNFFTKNNKNIILYPPYFFVSLIEDKTERPPF